MKAAPKALIFDVFGTLVDWRMSIAQAARHAFSAKQILFDPFIFADEWRGEYQPAMERIRSGNRGYVPLDQLHLENLEIVLERHGLSDQFDALEKANLNHAWERLAPWPDTVPGLKKLHERFILAPCSNGSIALLCRLSRFGSLPFDAIVGAEIAQSYKPRPEVYLKSVEALGLQPEQVMMVAAHNDDLHAAAKCGLLTGFIPRPMEFGDPAKAETQPTGDWDMVEPDMTHLASAMISH